MAGSAHHPSEPPNLHQVSGLDQCEAKHSSHAITRSMLPSTAAR
jgi:hypothetical protein